MESADRRRKEVEECDDWIKEVFVDESRQEEQEE